MREKIIEILTKYECENLFYVGCGAKYSNSKIHFNPNKAKLVDKKYALQFEEQTKAIVIWEIEKRMQLNKSTDLYVRDGSLLWSDISEVRTYDISIGRINSGQFSKVVLMPLTQLEPFLIVNEEFDFNIKISCKFANDEIESVKVVNTGCEGHIIECYGRKYERDRKLRDEAIRLHGCICNICNFDFEKQYGEFGRGYIEVHHRVPLSKGVQNVDPMKDLVCLCANCHRMIHRDRNKTKAPEEIKKLLSNK